MSDCSMPGFRAAGQLYYRGHYAQTDPYAKAEAVQKFQQKLLGRGRNVTFYTYPSTGHWFFEDNQPAYDARAAQLAWERTIEFLQSEL